jgi:cobyrinic acid a,c-diamide synthase
VRFSASETGSVPDVAMRSPAPTVLVVEQQHVRGAVAARLEQARLQRPTRADLKAKIVNRVGRAHHVVVGLARLDQVQVHRLGQRVVRLGHAHQAARLQTLETAQPCV